MRRLREMRPNKLFEMDKKGVWIPWLLSLMGHIIVVALWLVFGLAAAGNANSYRGAVTKFVALALVAAAIPLGGSGYLMAKGRFRMGFAATFLTLPSIVLAMFACMRG